jgi:hypothetical protein
MEEHMNLKYLSLVFRFFFFTFFTSNIHADLQELMHEIGENNNIQTVNESNSNQAITNLLGNYQRPITLVEIGSNDAPYILDFTKTDTYKSSYIALLLGSRETFTPKIIEQNLQNVIVLHPKKMTPKEFTIFSHCEHIDVVVLHDNSSFLKRVLIKSLDALLTLGEHTFIEVDVNNNLLLDELKKRQCTVVASNKKNLLLYHFYKKEKLIIHRWNDRDMPYNNKQYSIMSSFAEKFLIKSKANNVKSLWAPGINLKTFIMLYGIYPHDEIISKEIKAMRYSVPRHNDLSIPNMVIQGCKVIPIDIKHNGSEQLVETYIKISVEGVFNGSNKRLINPKEVMDNYRKLKHDSIIRLDQNDDEA